MAYIGSAPSTLVSRESSRVYTYTATAGQTVFTGADVNNQVLNVTPSDTQVHMNGLLLDATDYTVTSSSVTLGTAANAGDELTITGMVTFEVADTYDKTTADARYVNASGDTMTGTLNATGVARNTDGLLIGASSASTGYGLRIGASGATDPLEIWREHSNGNQMQLSVDYYGRVTMPYQPAFAAYALSTYTISGTGTYETIQANAVKSNIGSCYNTSTYLFTAPVSGSYAFFGTVRFNGHSGTYVRATFAINGSSDLNYASDINQDSGSYTTCTIASVIPLSANDTVSLLGRSQNDASVDISAGGTTFSGYLIG